MKDITPAKFRCGFGQCPGAWQDEDGSHILRGTFRFQVSAGYNLENTADEIHIRLPPGFLEAMFEEWLQNREMAKE